MRWYHLIVFFIIIVIILFVLTWQHTSSDLSYTIVKNPPVHSTDEAQTPKPTPTPNALAVTKVSVSPSPVPMIVSSTETVQTATDTYEIVGYVQNRAEEFIPNSQITIKNIKTPQDLVPAQTAVLTDEKGYYRAMIPGPAVYFYQVTSLPPGNYVECYKSLKGEDVQNINVINFVHDIGELAFWGKVIDKETKDPIPDARIELYPKRGHPSQKYPVDGKTQSDGTFYIDRLAEGPFEFNVIAHGYNVFESNAQGSQYKSGFIISPETQNREYLIQMTPARCILVRVKDEQKRPIPDATIELLMENQDYHPYSTARAKSDVNGECLLDMLPNLKTMINVQKEYYGEIWSEPVTPGLRGNPTVVDIVLPEESSISGTVTYLDGSPASGYTLYRLNLDLEKFTREGLSLTPAKTAQDGHYTFRGLGKGTYRISLFCEEQNQYYEEKDVPLKQNEHKSGVDFVIDESELTEEIRGRVVNASDEPIPGANIIIQMLQRNNPMLVTGLQGLGNTSTAETNQEGEFTIPKLRKADEYSIHVIADGYDTFNKMYKMDENDLTIVLESSSSLSGTVVDRTANSPIAGAKVEARPAGFTGTTQTTDCDEKGFFQFNDFKPGSYQLFAYADGYANAEELSITLKPNDKKTITIPMQSASGLRGTVLSPDQTPVAGVQLFLHSEVVWKQHPVIWNQEVSAAKVYKTNNDGMFQIPSISKQGDTLYCYHPAFAPCIYTIQPNWNPNEPLTLNINHGGSIEGKIAYTDGTAGVNKTILFTDNIDRPFFGRAVQSGEDGSFRFDNVPTISLIVMVAENESQKESIIQKPVMTQENRTVRVEFIVEAKP